MLSFSFEWKFCSTGFYYLVYKYFSVYSPSLIDWTYYRTELITYNEFLKAYEGIFLTHVLCPSAKTVNSQKLGPFMKWSWNKIL